MKFLKLYILFFLIIYSSIYCQEQENLTDTISKEDANQNITKNETLPNNEINGNNQEQEPINNTDINSKFEENNKQQTEENNHQQMEDLVI